MDSQGCYIGKYSARVNPFHDGSIIQCYCGYDSYISYFLLLISPLYYISFTEYRKDYLKM